MDGETDQRSQLKKAKQRREEKKTENRKQKDRGKMLCKEWKGEGRRKWRREKKSNI